MPDKDGPNTRNLAALTGSSEAKTKSGPAGDLISHSNASTVSS